MVIKYLASKFGVQEDLLADQAQVKGNLEQLQQVMQQQQQGMPQ
jgi:hypothetical protein